MNRNMIAAAVLALVASTGAVRAEPASTVTIAKCAITGPGIAVCGGIAVVGHELVKLLNGQDAFGANGVVIHAANTAWNDVTRGPSNTNDVVGRDGWLRQRLGF